MAFKCGRDSTIFTYKCILYVDVQRFSGKRVEFHSIPYSSIRSFSTESSGSLDRDSELKLKFRTPWLQTILRDFRSSQADIISIHDLIAEKTLSHPGKPSYFQNDNTIEDSKHGTMEKLIAYIGDKHLKIDPKSIERQFKTEVPLLQMDEEVELAFKHGRAMVLITTKRVVLVDVQGLKGNKIEFATFPFKHITSFSVQSAGSMSRTVKATLFTASLEGAIEK